MADQMEKQISAINLLGNRISWSLEESLKDPLAEMTQAMKGVSADQGTAVHGMMHELLDGFNKNLRELLGDQISNINETQQRTLLSLQQTMSRMEDMAGNIESAGTRGADTMASQLAIAMAGAESRQQVMNEKMGSFVEQLTLAVSHSQDAAQTRLQDTLDDIANRMGAVIQSMSDQIVAASDTGKQYQTDLAQEGRKVVGDFGERVDLMADAILQAVNEMKMAVSAMRHTTGTTVSQMNAGADRLYAASAAFAETGRDMTQTLSQASGLVTQFGQVAHSMGGISGELGKILADYQAARDTMTVFLESLRMTVDQSRSEAAITGEVLVVIEGATEKLVRAQKEADGYLSRVSEVIEEAHNTFTIGMVNAVDSANQDFHKALADSVTLLRIGIQELGTTLEELGTLRQSWQGNVGSGISR
jgi:hypothetical protein